MRIGNREERSCLNKNNKCLCKSAVDNESRKIYAAVADVVGDRESVDGDGCEGDIF